MSGTLKALPGDTIIEVTYPHAYELTVTQLLGQVTSLTGIWDGPDPPDPTQMTEPIINFRINALATSIGGCAWADICADAAVIAGRLTSLTSGWPGAEAHVRSWPQIDLNMQFVVAPGLIPATPSRTVDQFAHDLAAFVEGTHPDIAAALRDMFKPGCDCGCECCG